MPEVSIRKVTPASAVALHNLTALSAMNHVILQVCTPAHPPALRQADMQVYIDLCRSMSINVGQRWSM